MQLEKLNYCLDVIKLKQELEVSFLTLGEMLYKIKQGEMYYPQWENFSQYLEEIKISESVASRLIKVYLKLVKEFGIPKEKIALAGGWSNAYEIVQLSKNKEEAEKWLHDASLKTSKDVKIALREAKTGVKQEECQHDFYTLKVCRKCNHKELSQ